MVIGCQSRRAGIAATGQRLQRRSLQQDQVDTLGNYGGIKKVNIEPQVDRYDSRGGFVVWNEGQRPSDSGSLTEMSCLGTLRSCVAHIIQGAGVSFLRY